MATTFFLGNPPEYIRQWIIDHPPTPPASPKTVFHLQDGTTVEREIVGELGYDDWSNIGGTLMGVEIGSLVTSIGGYAFSDCTSLQSVTIPSSVTSIESSAFSNCASLQSVMIPSSVTSIWDEAFANCTSLKGVEIHPGMESIGWLAFSNCTSLESVTIPASVTRIGWDAFVDTPFYNNMSNGFIILGGGILYKYKGDCPPTVTIPSSVKSIGYSAFYNCTSLESVTIPSSVTIIGSGAFSDCGSLQSVTISSSVTSIEGNAFSLLPNNAQFTFTDRERSDVEGLLTKDNALGYNDDGIMFTMSCSDGGMTASFDESTYVWTFTYL